MEAASTWKCIDGSALIDELVMCGYGSLTVNMSDVCVIKNDAESYNYVWSSCLCHRRGKRNGNDLLLGLAILTSHTIL